MTIFKKAVSLILVLVISFTIAIPAFAGRTKDLKGPDDYAEMLWNEGYEALPTDVIVAMIKHFGRIFTIFSFGDMQSENLSVTLDEFTTDICLYIFENSGFDLKMVLQNLPNISIPANIAVEAFKIDTTAFREEMYKKRAECDKKGDGTTALFYHFLGVYFSIIEECQVFAEKTEDENIYELCVRLIFRDGTEEVIRPGVLVNIKTGECTNKDDSGMIGIGFNFSLSEMVVYATVNCWMREFGFCVLYDVAANMMPVVYKYDTRRFKFEYDGLQWMIQVWKGNYLVANGGEVGLYCRKPQIAGSFYECADDEKMLPMEMKVSHGDDVLVYKPLSEHWWINGFNLSGKMYLPESLIVEFSIIMPDKEMQDAFCKSIDNHYQKDVSYTVDGLRVNVVW